MQNKKTHRRTPIETFPIKPRKDGRFQKRINGRLYYFGQDGDRVAALADYETRKHDLYSGVVVEPADLQHASIKELSNRYLDEVRGEMSDENHRQYNRALRRFVKFIGPSRAWNTLTPSEFARYGKHLRSKLGGYSYNRERAAIVAMFNFADEQDWIDRVPKFGKLFRRVPRGELRADKRGRLVSKAEIKLLLSTAKPQMWAMILLAVNAGMGPKDIAAIPWDAIDESTGRVSFPRVKNNIPRAFYLWPETLKAMQAIRGESRLVFRTRAGNEWNGIAIAHQIQRHRKTVKKLARPITMYDFRHTFATHANEVRDTDARRHIMGRLLPNLDDVYVEGLFEQRLKRVTDHVRKRLSIADIVKP